MKTAMKFPSIKATAAKVKSAKVSDRWPTEVRQQTRRVTGVTPKLLGAYQESPARFIKRTSSLRVAAGQKKIKMGGA